MLWNKTFGKNFFDTLNSVIQTSDGGIVVAGTISFSDYDPHANDGLIMKLDSNGNEIWSKIYGGTNHDLGCSIKETSDKGYVILGYTLSNDVNVPSNHGNYDVWVFKMNSNGEL